MRIIKKIGIEEQEVTALFDTGALHTYVRECFLTSISGWTISNSYRVALGGRTIEVSKVYHLNGKIEGLDFDTEAVPVDEIGKVNGQNIDVIIGALTMEKWEIIPNPKDGTLNLEGLKRREFIEFMEYNNHYGVQIWSATTMLLHALTWSMHSKNNPVNALQK